MVYKDKGGFDSNRTLDSYRKQSIGKLSLVNAWSAHTFIMWANVPGTTWRAEGRPTRPNTSAAGAHPCRRALCRRPLATTTQRVFDHQNIDENGANMAPILPAQGTTH